MRGGMNAHAEGDLQVAQIRPGLRAFRHVGSECNALTILTDDKLVPRPNGGSRKPIRP